MKTGAAKHSIGQTHRTVLRFRARTKRISVVLFDDAEKTHRPLRRNPHRIPFANQRPPRIILSFRGILEPTETPFTSVSAAWLADIAHGVGPYHRFMTTKTVARTRDLRGLQPISGRVSCPLGKKKAGEPTGSPAHAYDDAKSETAVPYSRWRMTSPRLMVPLVGS